MIDNYKQVFSREQITTLLKNGVKRNVNSNNKSKTNSYSPYGQKLRESKKISLFYGGLSKKYFQKINHKNFKYPSKLSENIFIILESRLDVVLYRSGFFESIKSAKQMVRIGAIKVNNKIVISPGFFVTPGDILSVFGKNNKKVLHRDFEKKNGLPQKNLFFINRRYLKKTSQQNTAINLKEKIDIGKQYAKIKNQISISKVIGSRFKGSLMLLSAISFAFGYSGMLKAFKHSISNFTTTTSVNCAKSKVLQPFSHLTLLSPKVKATAKTKKEKMLYKASLCNSPTTSTYFDKNKSYILREKQSSLNIEKANSFGLCIIFINTIKNLIAFKDNKNLRKNYNDQDEKLASFFSRLTKFNNEIKINTISKKPLDPLFIFLNYLLNLKKQYSLLQKKKINHKRQQVCLFFKNQYLFEMKKTKASHLEVSYKSLSIVFLFSPQRVNFPFFLNPSLIYK